MHRFNTLCRPLWWALAFFVSTVFSATVGAAGLTTGWMTNPDHPPVTARFVLTGEQDETAKTLQGFLEVRLSGDWKTYWRSPGEGGIAPSMKWQNSENLSNVEWHWPHPKRFELLGIKTLGYKDDVVFPMTLTVKGMNKPVTLRANLTLSSCTTVCVLTDYPFELTFTPSDLVLSTDFLHTYAQGMNLVPKPSPQISALSAAWDASTSQLQVTVTKTSGWETPDVIVDGSSRHVSDVTFSNPELKVNGNTLTALFSASSWLGDPVLDGEVLDVTFGDQGFIAEQTVSVVPSSTVASTDLSILKIILFALLGGLILNIMPCVLPVLGMKLNGVISAQGIEKRQIRGQFIASALGIVVSFWLIALFLTVLKLTGSAIGWGIQFQNPYFIGFMVVVTGLFAANMLGLFEVQLPSTASTWMAKRGDNSYTGHFTQGMFATLLATPCSAPFLGTAVAFALMADTVTLFAIFTALALGMALPWLMVAVFPAVAKALPKPGAWMGKVKLLFGLMMLATALWLLSLLVNHVALHWLLLGCLAGFIVFLWRAMAVYGKRVALCLGTVIALAVATAFITTTVTDIAQEGPAVELPWEPLSEQRIAEAVNDGKVVFVDITAQWCITCKANKIGVLMQEPVHSTLQSADIIPMQGDWTVPSDNVTAYLQQHGRFGVPFNIVYGPAAPNGIPLPVILSSKGVIDAINTAKGEQ